MIEAVSKMLDETGRALARCSSVRGRDDVQDRSVGDGLTSRRDCPTYLESGKNVVSVSDYISPDLWRLKPEDFTLDPANPGLIYCSLMFPQALACPVQAAGPESPN